MRLFLYMLWQLSHGGFVFRRVAALCLLVLFSFIGLNRSQAQVATYYNFTQSNGTYTPIVADYPSTPASIYTTSWDDIAYSFPIPFDFTFNGVLYPATTGYIGLDTDAWLIFSNGVPTMTGQTSGGSWISTSDHTGVYLNGTANNNGFAGLNCDLNNLAMTTFTANLTTGSNVLTAVSSVANIRVGTRLSGTGIPNGTVVISNTANTITMSANATSTSTGATITPNSSIYYKVIGTAPNRQFVVQWTQVKRYGGTGTDNFNFQMILNEGGGVPNLQTLQVIYGGFSATSTDNLETQVGLRGASSADFNARTSATGWATTTAAAANTNTVRLSNTIFPASGLTFTWSPCTVAPAAAGAITGSSSVCPGSSQTYTLSPVSGATSYTWTYSGTGATFTASTSTPSNTITFSNIATGGTLIVTPVNLCGSGTSSSLAITVNAVTSATISYPSSSYCSNASGTVSVTQTGPTGGSYSTTPSSGLTINTSNGTITPGTSTPGTYTVTYAYTSSSCPMTATTTVTVNAPPAVTVSASPAAICSGSNSQLTATVTSGLNYSVISIPHSSLSPSGTPTVLWSTYTDDALSAAITMPFTFNYYGSAITQFYVSTNGHIQLQTSSGSSTAEQTLPDATTPNNVIALAWDDLIVDPSVNPGASVRYFVNGTAPNRILVIDYIGLKFLSGSGQNVTGQIRIYESDNHIEVAATTVNDNGSLRTKTLGIENSTGTLGVSPSGRNNVVWNTSNEAWSFFQPTGSHSFSWSPSTFLSNTTINNPMANGVTSNITYTVTTTNTTTGCSVSPTVSLTLANVGSTGAISGTASVCPGTSQTYTLPAVTNATAYNWTYSGTGVSLTASTASPSNTLTFGSGATGGTLTVTPANACGNGSMASISISVTSVTAATISYPLSSYCISASGSISVTRTGPSGGTYSTSPASGLTINTSTGAITPSSSTAGTYSVIYTYTSGSCTGLTATTTVTIAAIPVVTASASPSTVCAGSSAQLTASVPSAANYSVTSIPYSSLTSASPTVLYNSYIVDGYSAAITMPFSFNFYGSPITQFYVSTEGYIQLQSSSANSSSPQLLPNATAPNNIIAMAWDDLVVDPSTNTGSAVSYFVNGTSPNRILVVNYNNLRFIGGTGSQNVTGQIRLYESDSHIEVAIATVNDNATARNKTLGIENSTGTLATTPAGRNQAGWNVSNEAWSFSQPVGTFSYSWAPATFLSNTAIYNPVASGVTSTTNYTVTVTNTSTGCVGSANTTVTFNAGLNGTYTVGAGGNYTTLTAAINAYNTQCISGPIVFSLITNGTYNAGETFPLVINRNGYASAVNTLTIRPATGVTATISGSAASGAVIKILNDYVTIDGSNNGTTTRNLTITNTSATSPRVVWFGSSGTTYITNSGIRNCILTNTGTTTSNLLVSDGASAGSAGYFRNITIQNNLVQKGYHGVYCIAVNASTNGSGLLINGNDLSASGTNALYDYGIYLQDIDNAVVSGNTIGNFTGTNDVSDKGIWLATGVRNTTVSGNRIFNLNYTAGYGYGAHGIHVSTGTANANNLLLNNMIANLTGDGWDYTSATYGMDNPTGILLTTTQSGIRIYHNSINLYGSTINSANAISVCIRLGSGSSADIRNNILVNKLGRSGASGLAAIGIMAATISTQFAAIDYNNYLINPASMPNKFFGFINATGRSTLADWQMACESEFNAQNIDPVFTSSTDLHLVPASNITLSNKGTPLSAITQDYDAQSRNALTPDIGCDEWVEPNKGNWIGLVSTNWLTPANWEANYVPDGTTDVFITGGYTYMPTIATTQAVRDLNMSAPGAPTNIPILTLNNGVLQINRNINRTGGSINGSNGTLQMSGTVAQTIPASLFQNNNLKNLIIGNTNNVTGVTLGGALDIYGSVTFNASGLRLTTGNNLTFKSNLSGTAWLGNVTGKTITGNATVERYIPSGVNHGKSWQFVSVPLSGAQTINQAWQDTATSANQSRYSGFGTQLVSNISPLPALFDASGVAPSIKTYNPATNLWDGVLNTTSTAIANKRGYMVFVRGDRTVTTLGGTAVPTVLRAKGKLYTTGADLPPSTTVLADKYESIGNPYASAIDFLTITRPPATQVDDAFYVWDPLRYGSWGYGAYQTISSANGYKPIPGGTANYNAAVANTRIESGQAFMVHATGPSSGGTISFTETAKLTGSQMVFRQTDARLQDRQFINAYLYAVNGQTAYLADASVVAIDEEFNNNYNQDDALKLLNPGENLGIHVGDKTVALEARAPLHAADTIHYMLGNMKRQAYQFRFYPEKLETVSLSAFLFDRFLQLYYPVSLTDSSIISFTVNDQQASAAADRFILVFKPLQTVPVRFTGISALRKAEHTADVQWTVDNETGMAQYILQRSADGRHFDDLTVVQPSNNQGGIAEYDYSDSRAFSGDNYYRAKAVSRDGQIQFSDIARVGPFTRAAGIEVYPNPVVDGRMDIIFTHQPAGDYILQLYNDRGQLHYRGQVNIQQTSSQIFRVEPGHWLAPGVYQLRVQGATQEPRVITVLVN